MRPARPIDEEHSAEDGVREARVGAVEPRVAEHARVATVVGELLENKARFQCGPIPTEKRRGGILGMDGGNGCFAGNAAGFEREVHPPQGESGIEKQPGRGSRHEITGAKERRDRIVPSLEDPTTTVLSERTRRPRDGSERDAACTLPGCRTWAPGVRQGREG